MRAFLLIVAVILAVGLLVTADHPGGRMRVASNTVAAESVSAVGSTDLRKAPSSIAAYPDRGRLLAYDHERQVVRSGASTWHPVNISEAHALRAVAEGAMTVRAPSGEIIRLNYERHFEHPDGNWTWIGREYGSAPGTETVLTFGEKAVFGVIRQGNADLKLTTEAGSTWLVENGQADGSQLANVDDALELPNMSIPIAASASEYLQASGAVEQQIAGLATAQATSTTVDIAMGFTTGFATRLGGESQARTRLNFLVDVTNQAFTASGINARLRLVRSLQVDYSDDTSNRLALFDLTGVNCTEQVNGAQYMSSSRWDCTPITPPAGLQPLIAARETYGADVIVLVRKYVAPENVSCGSAWMLGGGQNTIDASSAAFGTTVVSDSSGDQFPSNGSTCPDLHLAHEIGHTMGQQHDLVTAMGSDDSDNNGNMLDPEEFGRHPYSFGYSTDGTASDIATIMSNRRPSQTRYRVFSSPLISSCGGAPCGTADQEDNARSMSETIPVIAAFRATVVAPSQPQNPSRGLAGRIDGDNRDDVLWFNPQTEELYYWLMSGGRLVMGKGGVYAPASATPRAMADVNSDGRADILLASGQDIWIYLGNSSGTFASAYLAPYPAGWDLVGMGDVDADGKADVVWHHPTTRELYYWLLDGATIRLGRGTVTTPAGTVPRLGDLNGDNRADVILPSTGDIWVYIGNVAGTFTSSYIASYPSGWNMVGAQDVDADGKDDLLWHHPTTGELYYWLMDGGAIQLGRGGVLAPTGTTPRILADFNGDGRADVFLPSGEHIWTYVGNTSGSFTSFYTAPYPAGWF